MAITNVLCKDVRHLYHFTRSQIIAYVSRVKMFILIWQEIKLLRGILLFDHISIVIRIKGYITVIMTSVVQLDSHAGKI